MSSFLLIYIYIYITNNGIRGKGERYTDGRENLQACPLHRTM